MNKPNKENLRRMAAEALETLHSRERYDVMGLGLGVFDFYCEYFGTAPPPDIKNNIHVLCQCIIDDKPYIAPDPANT